MEEFNDKYGKRFRSISPDAEQLLLSHQWPGNVRELRNSLERVILLENDETVLGRHLHFLNPEPDDQPVGISERFRFELPEEGISLDEVEKAIILKAYQQCKGNKAKTARYLRIPRHILLYRLKKYGLLS
jgi:DNA-binding NtrC family response regulator